MSFDFTTLITDRTASDVSRVREIASKIMSGMATDDELAEFNTVAMRGAYNYTDLNRVNAAMDEINRMFTEAGYRTKYKPFSIERPDIEVLVPVELPEGYTAVEYIESSGNRYFDTGFTPNNNTRVKMSAVLTETANAPYALFGARDGNTKQFWSGYGTGVNDSGASVTGFISRYNADSNSRANTSVSPTQKFEIDYDKTTFSINGESTTHTAATFTAYGSMFIFAVNNAGTATLPCKGRLYWFQIYDNDTLVRDFFPCVNPDGVAGLYDLVNGVFYGGKSNIPIDLNGYSVKNQLNVTPTIQAATQLKLANSSKSSVTSWRQISYCTTERLFVVGKTYTLSATTSVSANITLAPSVDILFFKGDAQAASVRAYNGESESITAVDYDEIRFYFRMHSTTSSVAWTVGDSVTIAFTVVGENVDFTVGEEIAQYETITIPNPYPVDAWAEPDVPTTSQMSAYLANVEELRSILSVLSSTPSTPNDMELLTWVEANNIEHILNDVYLLLKATSRTLLRSNMSWAFSGSSNFYFIN